MLTPEDIQTIKDIVGTSKNEYKFQWSRMTGGDQIVIRNDNKEEFDLLVKEYKGQSEVKQPPTVTTAPQTEGLKGVCKDCGAPMKISMKGNPYCSAKCWISGDK